jgi:hypothetical protein
MKAIKKFFITSALASSIAAPVQAQDPKQGDYYIPTQTTAQELTPAQLRQTQEGDYYVDQKMVLHHHRIAALTKCTDGIKFASDRYITCMLKEGENP